MKYSYCLLSLALIACQGAHGNPQGLHVISGEASSRSTESNTLQVTTGSKAILHWDDFSIGSGELTRFIMPDSTSYVLNRVVGKSLSKLMGRLEANGKIYLINPSGIYIDSGARIDTAGFLASTLDVLDRDFLSGKELLFSGDSKATLVHLGTINAWDGDIVLIGRVIDNKGSLNAPQGAVALAAGREVLLRPASNERVLIRALSVDESDKADVGIDHSGAITALQAELKAEGNPYACAIKDSGKIDALAIKHNGGKVFLIAEEGHVEVSGAIAAKNAQGKGGEVRILGNDLALRDKTEIDVSGERQGGAVFIGDSPRARSTLIEASATITADALDHGDGGEIYIWSQENTAFLGTLTARGGSQGGDGGFIEVSSRGGIAVEGRVDTSALFGKTGDFLIDPAVVTITTGADTNNTFVAPSYTFTASPANIQIATLQANLAASNVIINASASGPAATGTITVEGNITWASANSLTLSATDAGSFINLDPTAAGASVVISNTTTGGITVNGGANGNINIGAAAGAFPSGLQTVNGPISVTGNNITVLGGGGAANPAFIETTGSGNIAIVGNSTLTVNGGAGNTVNANAIITASGTGNISINSATSGSLALQILGGTGANSTALIDGEGSPTGVSIGQTQPLQGVTMTGGTGATSEASINSNANAIVCTIVGDYNLAAGSGATSSTALINGSGGAGTNAVQLSGRNFTLLGGTGAGTNQTLITSAVGTNIILNGSNNGSLTLQAGTAPTSDAEVDAGNTLTFNGFVNVNLTGGSGGTSSTAQLIGGTGGVQTAGITGNFNLQGGSSTPGAAQGLANIAAIGPITLSGNNYTLSGGNFGAGNNIAQINTTDAITLTGNGTFLIQGGAGANSAAAVETTGGGAITINSSAAGSLGLQLQGSSGAIASALIQTTGGGDVNLGTTNSLRSLNATGGTGAVSQAVIQTSGGAGGNITIDISGSPILGNTLTAGTGSTFSSAGITTGNTGNISLTFANNLTLTGGGGSGTNSAQILSSLGTVSIVGGGQSLPSFLALQAGSASGTGAAVIQSFGGLSINSQFASNPLSLTVQGGTGTGTTDALIETTVNGPVNLGQITTLGSISLSGGTGLFSPAQIITSLDGAINITANGTALSPGNISLLGTNTTNEATIRSAVSGGAGGIAIIAGKNLSVGNFSAIEAINIGDNITLVTDNLNPTPPALDGASFTLSASGLIDTGDDAGFVRIYTDNQPLNSINGVNNINGATFTAGTLCVNTNEEQWNTYFPAIGPSPADGQGFPFTVYYKFSCLTPPPPPTPPVPPAFNSPKVQRALNAAVVANAQMFFMFEDAAILPPLWFERFKVEYDRQYYLQTEGYENGKEAIMRPKYQDRDGQLTPSYPDYLLIKP